MSYLRVWWCIAVLRHHVTIDEYQQFTRYHCETCRRDWKLI